MEKLLQMEKKGDVYVDFTKASSGPIKYKREVKGAADMAKSFKETVSSDKNTSLKFTNLNKFMTRKRNKKSILTQILVYRAANFLTKVFSSNMRDI